MRNRDCGAVIEPTILQVRAAAVHAERLRAQLVPRRLAARLHGRSRAGGLPAGSLSANVGALMDHGKLKRYAQGARRAFIAAVEARAAHHGLTADAVEPVRVVGATAMIDGRPFPAEVAGKRGKLEQPIQIPIAAEYAHYLEGVAM
jgi:hypothetical protein